MRKFSLDKIALHVDAANIVSKFNELQKIKDYTYVTLWDEIIPEDVVVENFWGILDKMFKADGNRYKNCKLEIQYPGKCTSFRIEYVTDYEMKQITSDNQQLLSERLNMVNGTNIESQEINNGDLGDTIS